MDIVLRRSSLKKLVVLCLVALFLLTACSHRSHEVEVVGLVKSIKLLSDNQLIRVKIRITTLSDPVCPEKNYKNVLDYMVTTNFLFDQAKEITLEDEITLICRTSYWYEIIENSCFIKE